MNDTLAKSALCRTYGFQLSRKDAAVILLCAGGTWLAWPRLGELAILFPMVLGHFFLFCNVFRVFRKYEYVWASVLILNVCAWMVLKHFDWLGVLSAQTPLTIALILLQMRSPWYHGVGARFINKHLDVYLRGDPGSGRRRPDEREHQNHRTE